LFLKTTAAFRAEATPYVLNCLSHGHVHFESLGRLILAYLQWC